jgi:hypothetical protein
MTHHQRTSKVPTGLLAYVKLVQDTVGCSDVTSRVNQQPATLTVDPKKS